jgi:hypothetical protein
VARLLPMLEPFREWSKAAGTVAEFAQATAWRLAFDTDADRLARRRFVGDHGWGACTHRIEMLRYKLLRADSPAPLGDHTGVG